LYASISDDSRLQAISLHCLFQSLITVNLAYTMKIPPLLS
jgi:hypothetical protein